MSAPLADPAANKIPTDRQSLRELIAALTGQPDILGELSVALATGMGLDPRTVAALHQAADTDASALAVHHTLGAGPRQASPGNHDHGTPRIWRRSSVTSCGEASTATSG